MSLITYQPPPPLAEFVELFWHANGDPPPAHAEERVLPTGTVELVINLCDETKPGHMTSGAVVCGARSSYFVIGTADQDSVLGVHFKPGGAFPFLGVPAGELQDLHVGLDVLWGARAGELRERLLAAPHPQARFRLLEQYLLGQARSLARHPAVRFALQQFHRGGRPVTEVAADSGFSQRRFIQVFRDEVGLTPKLFCRVQRFQETLRRIECGPPGWVKLAVECGFFDQSHCIHDFQSFAGLSPTEYLARKGPHRNHVPLTG